MCCLFCSLVGVFIFGLGVGLQFNPTYGTILWIMAGVIFVLNLLWMFGVLGNAIGAPPISHLVHRC